MPAAGNDILFEALTPIGLTVRVTRNRWLVIVSAKHPVMAGRELSVRNALERPDEVRESRIDPEVLLFYKAEATADVSLCQFSTEAERRAILSLTMENAESRVTIHMAASLDGFIARKDGSVDWLETSDNFEGGDTMAPESVVEFLRTIDCYVMGSRTYETAWDFEAKGLGWSYGDKPTFVLTSRELRKTRNTVEFYSGDLELLVVEKLKPNFRSIWFVGGGEVSGECLRLGLADEVRYSIMPILIGDGISFFEGLHKDVALHLVEAKAYKSGMVALRYEVRR